MIQFDLILIFRDRAQNVWWYWRTPEEAVSWARDLYRDLIGMQVAWNTGMGLRIQEWKPEPRLPDESIDHEARWSCLEMD